MFVFGIPFEKPWYNVKNKSTKSKLGKFYHSTLKKHSKDKEKPCLCRLIDLERISAYVIEGFENRMKNLNNILGAERFWL